MFYFFKYSKLQPVKTKLGLTQKRRLKLFPKIKQRAKRGVSFSLIGAICYTLKETFLTSKCCYFPSILNLLTRNRDHLTLMS